MSFHVRDLAEFACKPLQYLSSQFGMGDLAASENYGSLDPGFILQKTDDVVSLELVIVTVDLGPKLDFLHLNDFLVLSRLLGLLPLLVQVLPMIHYPADWRSGRRCNFHQIQAFILCQLTCFRGGHDAQLSSVFVDNSNFPCPDSEINAYPLLDKSAS